MNEPAITSTSTAAPGVAVRALPPVWVVVIVLLVAGLFVNFWRLGEGPIAGTEPHRVIPGHEMAQGGTWVAQKLLDRWYMTKPPGMAWVIAVAERVTGGSNPWVWRTPGALCGVALPLVLWWALRRWAGDAAGLGAGLATFALFALWSQNKSAETDGVLTLFTMIGALAAMHVGLHPQKRRHLGAAIIGCLAFTATMMLKGPVTLPVWIGAVIGTAWATGRWRWIARPAVWIGLVVGTVVFAWWMAAMRAEMARRGVPIDYFGAKNFGDRLTAMNVKVVLLALAMPLRLIAYSLPISAVILLMPRRRSDGGEGGDGGEPGQFTVIARAGAVGFVVAIVIYSLARIEQPRYGYPALPLLAVVAGAVAAAWRRGEYSEIQVTRLRQMLTGVTVLFAGLAIGLAAVVWRGSENHAQLIAAIAAAVAIGGWGVAGWVKRDVRTGLIAGLGLLVVAGVPFADFKSQNLRQNSSYRSAIAVRKIVGGGGPAVLAAWVAVHQPELLWYADVKHKWAGYSLDESFAPGGWRGWVVLNAEEWKHWSATAPQQFTKIHELPQPAGTVLVWHEPAEAR